VNFDDILAHKRDEVARRRDVPGPRSAMYRSITSRGRGSECARSGAIAAVIAE
jgi:hypothetical protein